MNKNEFKQRMKSLKSYRELNPDKGYWDWKVELFLDGGELSDDEKIIINRAWAKKVMRDAEAAIEMERGTRHIEPMPLRSFSELLEDSERRREQARRESGIEGLKNIARGFNRTAGTAASLASLIAGGGWALIRLLSGNRATSLGRVLAPGVIPTNTADTAADAVDFVVDPSLSGAAEVGAGIVLGKWKNFGSKARQATELVGLSLNANNAIESYSEGGDNTPMWLLKPYSGPTYDLVLESLKKDDPAAYNRLAEARARELHPTSEIVHYINADKKIATTSNASAGFVSGTDPIGAFIVELFLDGGEKDPRKEYVSSSYKDRYPNILEKLLPYSNIKVRDESSLLLNLFSKADSIIYTPILDRVEKYLLNNDITTDLEKRNAKIVATGIPEIVIGSNALNSSKEWKGLSEGLELINNKVHKLTDKDIKRIFNADILHISPKEAVKLIPKGLNVVDIFKIGKYVNSDKFRDDYPAATSYADRLRRNNYEWGGEIPPSDYQGSNEPVNVNPFTKKPLANGSITPVLDLEDASGFTPIGDILSIRDAYIAAKNRDLLGLGLAGLGFMPFIPTVNRKATQDLFDSYKSKSDFVKDYNMVPITSATTDKTIV